MRIEDQSLRRHRSINRPGFTLVELLVVIGIIALLISILLPALSKARDSANKAVCLSNQKQIVLAIIMYTGDNKGVFPGPCVNAVFDPYVTNPINGAATSLLNQWNGGSYYDNMVLSETGMIQKYLGGVSSRGVWFCPANSAVQNAPCASTYSAGLKGKQLGYGYRINDDGHLTGTNPPFLFGSYRAADAVATAYKTTTNVDGSVYTWPVTMATPARITDVQVRYGAANLWTKDSTKAWLVSDIDARNYSSDTGSSDADQVGSTTFCIHASTSSDTVATKNTYPFQPVHRASKSIPAGLVRNYGYLDGHCESLTYAGWPGNGVN